MKKRRCQLFLLVALALTQQSEGAAWGEEIDWLNRGIAEYSSRQYNQAVSSLSLAVNKNERSDLAHYYLANSLLMIGHKTRALQEYEKACKVSQTAEMYRNCAQVLTTYNAAVPPPPPMGQPMRRRSVLDQYQVSSLDRINSLAEQKSDGKMKFADSHRDGLEVFRCSPEGSAELKAAWDQWIENYRLIFGSTLGPRVRGAHIGKLSGRALMVFSVDKNRRLRGRIVKSDAPVLFNYYLLETTRRIDRAAILDFPAASTLPGYNFTMTWDYGASRNGTDTVAELLRTEAALRNQQALAANAGTLSASDTNAALRSSNTSAALRNSNTSATMRSSSTSTSLRAYDADAMMMPKFDTKVSAQILPKQLPVELKASPGKLDTGTKKRY
ncbi:MAG: hypothetical protein Q8T09_24080 [Candidatus Melainabacteria bacterium]|nr:hypothetical protein [Candidatus Melainabacteria bacterium]